MTYESNKYRKTRKGEKVRIVSLKLTFLSYIINKPFHQNLLSCDSDYNFYQTDIIQLRLQLLNSIIEKSNLGN
jgi:hypothetical protein